MNRFSIILFFFIVFALSYGCEPGGVGDPCDPISCPAPPEDDPFAWKRCDWDENEIYLESRSLQCRTRVCMVYKITPDYQDPNSEGERAPYCTRPCGTGATYEECPAGYCCMEIVTGGKTAGESRGYYCVKKSDLLIGKTEISKEDCDKIHKCYKSGIVKGNVKSYTPRECEK